MNKPLRKSAKIQTSDLYGYLRKLSDGIPLEYRVEIKPSKHFLDRISERHDGLFNMIHDVLRIVQYNYPLILYYTKLDTVLPDRGRLESDEYVICGDVVDNVYVLRTIYRK